MNLTYDQILNISKVFENIANKPLTGIAATVAKNIVLLETAVSNFTKSKEALQKIFSTEIVSENAKDDDKKQYIEYILDLTDSEGKEVSVDSYVKNEDGSYMTKDKINDEFLKINETRKMSLTTINPEKFSEYLEEYKKLAEEIIPIGIKKLPEGATEKLVNDGTLSASVYVYLLHQNLVEITE